MIDALSKRLNAIAVIDGDYLMPDDNGVERTGACIIAKSDGDLKELQKQKVQSISEKQSESSNTAQVVKKASEEAVNASQNTVNTSGAVQKAVLNMVYANFSQKGGIQIRYVSDEGNEPGYQRIAPLPVFVKTDSGFMINKRGNPVAVKFSVMVKKLEDGSISVDFRALGSSKKILDTLDEKAKAQLIETAKAMLKARLADDKQVSDKLMRVLIGKINADILGAQKETIASFEKEIKKMGAQAQSDLKALGYSAQEIEQLLDINVVQNVIPVGIKETELKVTPKLDIARRLDVEKRAGTTTIVLKGQYSVDTVQFIRERGFEVIIVQEVNGKINIDLSKYIGLKELSGIRFEITEKGAEQTIGNITGSFGSISISYDFGKDITSESVEFVKKQNATLVVDAGVIADKTDVVSAINNAKLAENAQIVLRIESDNDDNAIALMENAIKLLGMQGQKLSINVKKTLIKSRDKLMNVFKADPASEYRLKGLDESFEAIFGNVNAEIVAKELSRVISGDMKYEEFNKDFNAKFSALFADKSEIENIISNKEITPEVKMTLIRQYVIGIFIAHVGKEIIPQIAEDMPFDIDTMKLNAKQVVVYEVIQLLMNGKSVSDIKSHKFTPDQTQSLFDMVNSIMSRNDIKNILRAWNMTDMVIETLNDSKAVEKIEDIHTLIFDSIKVDDIGDKIAVVTLDGIKATLSAA